jgi:hypothetical protein
MLSLPLIATLATAGVAVDRWLGEPRIAHPLVGFGKLAMRIETRLNTGARGQLFGILGWALAVLPPVLIAAWLVAVLPFMLACAVHVLLLWFALGARSLNDHIAPIARALAQHDLAEARRLTARIVSRETGQADESALARAAVESALENGNDAIFGALFWFAIGGGPGALAFRLANTLDAMWGYRTPRYLRFGWAAARIDDVPELDSCAPDGRKLCAARRYAHRVALLARAGAALGQSERGAGHGVGRRQPQRAARRRRRVSRRHRIASDARRRASRQHRAYRRGAATGGAHGDTVARCADRTRLVERAVSWLVHASPRLVARCACV